MAAFTGASASPTVLAMQDAQRWILSLSGIISCGDLLAGPRKRHRRAVHGRASYGGGGGVIIQDANAHISSTTILGSEVNAVEIQGK